MTVESIGGSRMERKDACAVEVVRVLEGGRRYVCVEVVERMSKYEERGRGSRKGRRCVGFKVPASM